MIHREAAKKAESRDSAGLDFSGLEHARLPPHSAGTSAAALSSFSTRLLPGPL